METSRVDRTTLIEGLKERGYNAALMVENGWDEEGYYMFLLDSKGRKILDGGYAHRVFQYWDHPSDYKFVRDWYEEFVDE